jgi:predicted phosphodiesterase
MKTASRGCARILRLAQASTGNAGFVSYTMAKQAFRIAAIADLHYAKHSRGKMQEAFAEISRSADVLLLCGDLTEYGLPEEADELAADIRSSVRIPCIGVIGNHDYESGQQDAVAKILDDTGVIMLNGEAAEIAGVGFAGICGFGGVFHGHAHNGALDGTTGTGIPVYNVSAPALHQTGKPYRIVEL